MKSDEVPKQFTCCCNRSRSRSRHHNPLGGETFETLTAYSEEGKSFTFQVASFVPIVVPLALSTTQKIPIDATSCKVVLDFEMNLLSLFRWLDGLLKICLHASLKAPAGALADVKAHFER